MERSFNESVAAAPATVCDQLSSLEKKQREELTGLGGQIDTLLRESRDLRSAAARLPGITVRLGVTGERSDEIVWARRDRVGNPIHAVPL